jgi:hypothetical protein
VLNHSDGGLWFLDNGWIDLDTKSIERVTRAVALGRVKALLAGCDEDAEAWAGYRRGDPGRAAAGEDDAAGALEAVPGGVESATRRSRS